METLVFVPPSTHSLHGQMVYSKLRILIWVRLRLFLQKPAIKGSIQTQMHAYANNTSLAKLTLLITNYHTIITIKFFSQSAMKLQGFVAIYSASTPHIHYNDQDINPFFILSLNEFFCISSYIPLLTNKKTTNLTHKLQHLKLHV